LKNSKRDAREKLGFVIYRSVILYLQNIKMKKPTNIHPTYFAYGIGVKRQANNTTRDPPFRMCLELLCNEGSSDIAVFPVPVRSHYQLICGTGISG